MIKYLTLSVSVFMLVIAFAAWLPNFHLITKTMTSSTMTLWQKTNLLTSLLGSLQTNFTPLSRSLTIISAALTGIQTSLFIYYLRQSVRIQREMGVSLAGVATSLLGVGCVSCGSVMLTSLIGFGAATTVLGALPFRGQEFGFAGIAILLFAISFTLKKINQPYVCEVKKNNMEFPENWNQLSKHERKQFKRNYYRKQQIWQSRKAQIKKYAVIALIILFTGVGGYWLVKELTKPLPGEFVASLGNKHIANLTDTHEQYNSLPPTSGSHVGGKASWG